MNGGGILRAKNLIDGELRDRLADGRLLPIVDVSLNDEAKERKYPGYPLARLIVSTDLSAVIAYSNSSTLHSALADLDAAWRLADGYYTRDASGTKTVLSAGPVDGAGSWEDAWLRVEDRQPVLWELMSSYAARFPLLLIGANPESGALQDLVARLRPHRYFRPAGWIVAEGVSGDAAKEWEELGLTLVTMTTEAFVRACTEAINRRSYPVPGWTPDLDDEVAVRPFKLLDYYDTEDASIFYARREETDSLVRLVTSNRLVILTGPSGAGKTSLLKAGLIAHVDRMHPYRGVYVRLMEDPIAELLGGFERQLGISCRRPYDVVQRRMIWRAIDGTSSLPIVIFDQAEELFTRFEETMRDELFALIVEAISFPRSRVRFVFSIREDYLSNLADFAGQLPGILQTSFYVGALSREQAHEAIRRPFEAFGIHLEVGLETEIVDSIGAERVASPQIQIVCDKLFGTQPAESITFAHYEALGGTKGILSAFLNGELEKLGEDRAAVVELLKSLVTSEGTKDVLSLEEICERSGLSLEATDRLARYLTTAARLLRPVSSRSGLRYELAHEYLTYEIWQWMSPAEISRREAQELISADLRAWITFDSLRLGVDRLDKYDQHASNIKVDENVGTLLLLSCVRHSRPHGTWLNAIKELPPSAQTRISWSLLRFIASRSDDERFEAAEAMASLGSDVIVAALSVEERDIRHAALFMVGGLRLSSAKPVLLEMFDKVQDEQTESLACLALGEIGGDGAVEILISRTSSTSPHIAAAAVRGLGGCHEEVAFPHLMAALWGDQPSLIRAGQLAIASAASAKLSAYLARNMEAAVDVNGRSISLGPAGRLARVLEGLDHARVGDDHLLKPFLDLIRAGSVMRENFSAPWLVDGLKRVTSDGGGPKRQGLPRLRGSLHSADEVVAALQKYRTDSVANALLGGGSESLAILRGLSSHDSVAVRLTVLMALSDYAEYGSGRTWRSHIRPSLLVRGLQDGDAAIRYYACLAVKNLELVECVPFLRRLARDDARGSWYTASVGKRVSDAAHLALDALRPESRVWRSDWQLDVRPL